MHVKTRKDGNQKIHVETKEEDLHYVPKSKDSEEQLLSIKIQNTKKKKSKYIQGRK